MYIIHRVIDVPGRSATVRITPLADIHAGTIFCDEALVREWVKRIAEDEFHFWIGMGDYAEFINRKEWRHRASHEAKWLHGRDDIARLQVEWLADTLAPIRHKCLGLIRGNHEDSMVRHYERDVYYDLVQAIKTDPNDRLALGTEGFLRVTLRRSGRSAQAFDFYLHHGYGGGKLLGADALELGRLATSFDFDVALMGHRHRLVVIPGEVRVGLSASGRLRLVRKDMRAALCGSFRNEVLEGVECGYARRKGYPPKRTGPLTIELEAFCGKRVQRNIRIIS